jgi:hypothetical protein
MRAENWRNEVGKGSSAIWIERPWRPMGLVCVCDGYGDGGGEKVILESNLADKTLSRLDGRNATL